MGRDRWLPAWTGLALVTKSVHHGDQGAGVASKFESTIAKGIGGIESSGRQALGVAIAQNDNGIRGEVIASINRSNAVGTRQGHGVRL